MHVYIYIYMSLFEFGLWRNTAFAGVTQSYCYWGVAQSCAAAAGALAWLLTPEAVEVEMAIRAGVGASSVRLDSAQMALHQGILPIRRSRGSVNCAHVVMVTLRASA